MEKTRNIQTCNIDLLFNSYIESFFSQNISDQDIISVGVSGGVDSMFLSCLLYSFFVKQKYNLKNLVFIHLNHNVREESLHEAEVLKQRFKGTNFVYIARPKTLKTTENSLRKRRYSAFLDTMNHFGSDKIFLGHHFDDRVETSILNLIRGCGIDGFMSIKPKESHHLLDSKLVLRPILPLRKAEILAYCKSNKIPYFQDITNKDSTVSQRNYIRNEILPNLFSQKGFDQLFIDRYKRYDSQSIQNLLRPIITSPYRKAKSAYCLIKDRKEIDSQDVIRILKQLHASAGINRETIGDLLPFIKTGTKGRKQIQGAAIILAHDKVYFFIAQPRFREKTIDKKTNIDNLEHIQRYPQKGDVFKGKTWNKYCIAQKIPVFWRNFIPVVADGNKIISWDKKNRESNV